MKRTKVLSRTTTTNTSSRPGHLICPACEFGELQPRGGASAYLASCDVCNRAFSGAVLRILEQIAALPDALGKHACEECHHPEMRLLPDEVFHCPGCGAEVRPIVSPLSVSPLAELVLSPRF
jgi:ribosomal protein L37AE/L43A